MKNYLNFLPLNNLNSMSKLLRMPENSGNPADQWKGVDRPPYYLRDKKAAQIAFNFNQS